MVRASVSSQAVVGVTPGVSVVAGGVALCLPGIEARADREDGGLPESAFVFR